jgi:CS domain
MAEEPTAPVAAAPAVRIDWYQTETHITIEIMLKKVDPATSLITISPKNVRIFCISTSFLALFYKIPKCHKIFLISIKQFFVSIS